MTTEKSSPQPAPDDLDNPVYGITDERINALIKASEVFEYHPGALLEFAHEVAKEAVADDFLRTHAIEELHQLGYTVQDGNRLVPPDHLHLLMQAARHPLAASRPESMRCAGCDLINGCPEYCRCKPAVQAPEGEDLVTDSRINELAQEHGITAEGYWSEDAIAFGRDLLRAALAAQPQAAPVALNAIIAKHFGNDPLAACKAQDMLAEALAAQAPAEGDVVVTWTHDRSRILAVTRQDREGHILKVIAQVPASDVQPKGTEAESQEWNYVIECRDGFVPNVKGPFNKQFTESTLREFAAMRPSYLMVVRSTGWPEVQSGVEWIDMCGDKRRGRLAVQAPAVVDEPVAWANFRHDPPSYVVFKTREQAQRSVNQSELSATQEGPYSVVALYGAPQAPASVGPELADAGEAAWAAAKRLSNQSEQDFVRGAQWAMQREASKAVAVKKPDARIRAKAKPPVQPTGDAS